MPFVALREFRDLEKNFLPSLASNLREIVIDLASARQLGSYLTMKQLVLLQGGTATTVRRRVAHLMALGHVVKRPHQSDGRSDYFDVSECVWSQMSHVGTSLQQMGAGIHARAAKSAESSQESGG
jgi:hypothetical protein